MIDYTEYNNVEHHNRVGTHGQSKLCFFSYIYFLILYIYMYTNSMVMPMSSVAEYVILVGII